MDLTTKRAGFVSRVARRAAWPLVVAGLALCLPAGSAARVPRPPVGMERYSVAIVVDGVVLQATRRGRDRWVGAEVGARYAIRVTNHTAERVEVVVSVDGRDVIDGDRANFQTKRGYLLGPYQSYDIEGFRTSYSDVAAFRFSAVRDSYAARRGDPANVGVVGAAFFPERRRARPVVPFATGGGRGPKHAPAPAGVADGAAESVAPADGALLHRARRQEVGTAFGERRRSDVYEAAFERDDPLRPALVLSLRYDDCRDLHDRGIPVDCPSREIPAPFAPAPGFTPPPQPFSE